MNSETAYKQQGMVEKAIDALIDMEGTVYPNGLPPQLSSALQVLRARCSYLGDQGDTLKTEEDDQAMLQSAVRGAMSEQEENLAARCTRVAVIPFTKKKYFAKLTINNSTKEYPVRVTSKDSWGVIFVQRWIESGKRWGTRRYRLSSEQLRVELVSK